MSRPAGERPAMDGWAGGGTSLTPRHGWLSRTSLDAPRCLDNPQWGEKGGVRAVRRLAVDIFVRNLSREVEEEDLRTLFRALRVSGVGNPGYR